MVLRNLPAFVERLFETVGGELLLGPFDFEVERGRGQRRRRIVRGVLVEMENGSTNVQDQIRLFFRRAAFELRVRRRRR